ncbi:MAG: ATP-binding protein, partial [Solirubrobacterales bacterium]
HLASLRDITERKRAEEAAREANATLRSFYDASQMMMGVVEIHEGDILFVSSNNATASFYGVGVEGLDGRRISRLGVAPGVVDLWIARYREAERTGMPVRFEYAHEARGGRTWLSVTVGYIGRTPKGCSQFSFVAEDISDRKLAEEALREADRRKDELLAMLAHELRNPLAAISNAVQLALRTGPGDRWAWSHEVIGRQCAHLTGLIDDLLDVSRITRGKIQLRTEPLDAGSVLHDALEVVRPLFEERRHQLDVSIGPGLRLEADPTRLEQILVNLLTNAAKYTEPGGRIRVDAARSGDEVVIAVEDNGIGIDTAMLSHVFEPFAQVDSSIDRSRGGLGIGLTLVRTLAEMHGGKAEVDSPGPGLGSRFSVRLPAIVAPTDFADAAPESLPRESSRVARVLIVDDNRDAADLTGQILVAEGHEVRIVYDGPAALAGAREFRPDIVLLDIGLPGMDGYQVASALRDAGGDPPPMLVAVSGYGEEQARRRSHASGCAHHLVKPVNIDALLDLVGGVPPRPSTGRDDPRTTPGRRGP